jgi:hypothetical protein
MSFSNYTQRFCVWLVALARTKLAKETKPVENSAGIFRVHMEQAIGYTRCCGVVFLLFKIQCHNYN